ncbi:LysR family transcriptional regulator [Desulfitobacterium hafniense]|uniref:LysR family transcriptional regulator n=1 Tax=Desulfitobacterium hafniense TaxID=49338 RepID=UPI00037EE30B|nr:LysR family transcriptional regulator [Desulfitobacterium hafniense]
MYDLGLEAFLAVARTQNISRAAAKLNLAQSTISKRIQVLEQQIDTTLLERRHGVTLTPAGEKFVDLAEQWDHLKHQIESFHMDAPKLSLTVGTVNSLMQSIILPLFKHLSQHQPHIRLKILHAYATELYEKVESRQVDVAFTLREITHPVVSVEKCYTEPMVVIQGSEQPIGDLCTIHPHDLDPNQELYLDWGPSYEIWHDKWWDPYNWTKSQITTSLIIPVLLQNPGKWVIVPFTLAQDAIASGHVRMFCLSEAPPDRTVYKLTHKAPKAATLQSLSIFNEIFDSVLPHFDYQAALPGLLPSNPK